LFAEHPGQLVLLSSILKEQDIAESIPSNPDIYSRLQDPGERYCSPLFDLHHKPRKSFVDPDLSLQARYTTRLICSSLQHDLKSSVFLTDEVIVCKQKFMAYRLVGSAR
jgi:hypothetical protein